MQVYLDNVSIFFQPFLIQYIFLNSIKEIDPGTTGGV